MSQSNSKDSTRIIKGLRQLDLNLERLFSKHLNFVPLKKGTKLVLDTKIKQMKNIKKDNFKGLIEEGFFDEIKELIDILAELLYDYVVIVEKELQNEIVKSLVDSSFVLIRLI